MEVFRIWVELDPVVIRTLKARAITQDINFRAYLGQVLAAAAESDPIAQQVAPKTPRRRATDVIQQPATPTPTTAA